MITITKDDMNKESREILENANADLFNGEIEYWQYADIVLSTMKAELDERITDEPQPMEK